MPKENSLGAIQEPIDNADLFRMVSALGLSKNATGERIKAFLVGTTTQKVPDYYYFQDAANPVLNDYRLFSDGIFYRTQRYNGVIWEDIAVDGGSSKVFHLLEIIKEVTADIVIKDGDSIRNLIKSSTWSDGTTVGDIDGDCYINTADKLHKTKQIGVLNWRVLQSNFSSSSTGTSFYVNNTVVPGDGFVVQKLKIKSVGMPAGVKAQLKVYQQSDLAKPVWENATDVEIAAGIGADVDPTTGEMILAPRFYILGSKDVRLVLNFSEEVTLQGSNALGTDIYFESYDAEVAFIEITDEENVATHYEAIADRNQFSDVEQAKLDGISGDSWSSGLLITENTPKDQKVIYEIGSYKIGGIVKTITPAGVYDLESSYGAVDHYAGMANDQHAFVSIVVDADEAIKSVRGIVVEKGEIAHPPLIPDNSVCIAEIEIKVDKNDNPKDIDNKSIKDCRRSGSVNTDRTLSISADDLTQDYLFDKIDPAGSVTATITNPGGIEQIKFDAAGGSPEYGELYSTVEGLDIVPSSTHIKLIFDAAGLFSGTTLDVANDRITVASSGAFNIKFSSNPILKKNEIYSYYLYVNGVQGVKLYERYNLLDNAQSPISFSRPATLAAGDYVEIWVGCSASKDYIPSAYTTFNVEKL